MPPDTLPGQGASTTRTEVKNRALAMTAAYSVAMPWPPGPLAVSVQSEILQKRVRSCWLTCGERPDPNLPGETRGSVTRPGLGHASRVRFVVRKQQRELRSKGAHCGSRSCRLFDGELRHHFLCILLPRAPGKGAETVVGHGQVSMGVLRFWYGHSLNKQTTSLPR